MAAESKLERWAVQQITRVNGRTRKVKWIGRRGAPDRLVWIPQWEFPELWEFKAPGAPLEDYQEREHKRLNRMGFVCRKIDTQEEVYRHLT